MGQQLGFLNTEKRLAALSAKGNPLAAIDRLVPGGFRHPTVSACRTPLHVTLQVERPRANAARSRLMPTAPTSNVLGIGYWLPSAHCRGDALDG